MELDPVSGNTVPPGAAPNEVRDDVDAKLSTGEYVLSADVVRYIGVEKIESLVRKAKEGLQAMTQGQEELPFPPEELQSSDVAEPSQEPVKMAAGGLVLAPFTNQNEDLPEWMINPDRQNSGREEADGPIAEPTGLAGSVDKWSINDFTNYGNQLGSTGARAIEGLVGTITGGLGKLAMQARQNYLNKEVPTRVGDMLKTGKDLQGNKLTPEQITALQNTQKAVAQRADYSPANRGGMFGAMGRMVSDVVKDTKAAKEKEEGLISRKTEDDKPSKDSSGSSESDKSNNQGGVSGSSTSMSRGHNDDEDY